MLAFASDADWEAWLEEHHVTSDGVWVKIAKKGTGIPTVAYDGTHGYSDQYLVELPVFLDCAREAGLYSDPRFGSRFPSSELATVSLNFFTTSSSETAAISSDDRGRERSC